MRWFLQPLEAPDPVPGDARFQCEEISPHDEIEFNANRPALTALSSAYMPNVNLLEKRTSKYSLSCTGFETDTFEMPVDQGDRYRAALHAFMARRHLNIHSWTKAAGIPDSNLRKFLEWDDREKSFKANSLSTDVLQPLADAAGASIGEILGEIPKIPQVRKRGDQLPIKRLQARFELDGSLVIEREPTEPSLYWPRAWVDEYLGGRADDGRIHVINRPSTLNELRIGDVLCVNLKRTDSFRDPGPYVFHDGIGLGVRLLQELPAKKLIRVMSDSAGYEPVDVANDDIRIIGRVVWRAGAL
jgi:hypothetical protein